MFCVSAGFPLQSWVFTKGQGKGALTPTPPSEGPESTAIEVEDIPALLRDVARFAEAVEKLKDVVLAEGERANRLPSGTNHPQKHPIRVSSPVCVLGVAAVVFEDMCYVPILGLNLWEWRTQLKI